MPELPDIEVYVAALKTRVLQQRLQAIRIKSPFLVRSFEIPLRRAEDKKVTSVGRLGKRIVFGLEEELYLVLHLMIAGRLHWKEAASTLNSRQLLGSFHFPNGTLTLTEAGAKKRAALHLVEAERGLRSFDSGGLELLNADFPAFKDTLLRQNHTLKRALTDPHLFSGIGNAYSDEILHTAKLSPLQWTSRLNDQELERLFQSARSVLIQWTQRLMNDARGLFPEKVTAFRPGMAVHGRYREPCPVCSTAIQRIVYADNESNYCPTCQTQGRLLADRAWSRLLKNDWPRTLEELEQRLVRR